MIDGKPYCEGMGPVGGRIAGLSISRPCILVRLKRILTGLYPDESVRTLSQQVPVEALEMKQQ